MTDDSLMRTGCEALIGRDVIVTTQPNMRPQYQPSGVLADVGVSGILLLPATGGRVFFRWADVVRVVELLPKGAPMPAADVEEARAIFDSPDYEELARLRGMWKVDDDAQA